MRRLSPILLMLAMALLLPAAAFAQSPTQTGYGEAQVLEEVDRIPPPTSVRPGFDVDEQEPLPTKGEDETVVPAVERESGAPPTATTTGELPFTGFDAAMIALMGLALLATGLVLRRTRGTHAG